MWRTVRDCVAGQMAVKSAKTRYLPAFEPADESRYADYVQRAVFLGVTNRTRNSLVGAAFRKDPEFELPQQIEYIREDADGNGNSLTQVARSLVSNLVAIGRHGLLVDYPEAPEGLSAEQVARSNLRPFIREYTAENIINWRVTRGKLSLVVLREANEVEKDEFHYESEYQYRVLRLVEGIYTQQIYDHAGNPVGEPMEPRQANGSRWDVIPFIVAGSTNNDINIDYVTLYDLAELNISHYRNSADYEEGVFLHGQPMLHIDTGEMSGDVWNTLNPNGVQVGARRGLVTNQGGSAQLMQAQPNGAAFEALTHKEAQMLQIGARLIEAGGANETAEAVRAKTAAEHSVLDSLVYNAQDAIESAIEWVSMFAGVDASSVIVSLNRDFFDYAPDANMISQMMGLEASGIISKPVIFSYLRKTGVVPDDMTDEEIIEAAETSEIPSFAMTTGLNPTMSELMQNVE